MRDKEIQLFIEGVNLAKDEFFLDAIANMNELIIKFPDLNKPLEKFVASTSFISLLESSVRFASRIVKDIFLKFSFLNLRSISWSNK